MRLLVTGATGFLGSHLVKRLLQKGIDMAILARSQDRVNAVFNGFNELTIINLRDICWKEKLNRFDPEIVIHLMSHLTNKRDAENMDQLIEANICQGMHIFDALEGSNLRYFINIGSFAEYLNNDGILKSASLYAATKSSFRNIISFYQSLYKFKWINVVPYTIYGGGLIFEKKAIDFIVESLFSDVPIRMSGGEQVLDFIHINDVCDFFIRLVNNLEKIDDDYIEFMLGTGKGTSIREVASIAESVFGRKANIAWGSVPYREIETMYSVANLKNSTDILGWVPQIGLSKGIQMIYDDLLEIN